MVGTGYVGLVSGACFADLGNAVYCVDKDHKKIDMLNEGQIPIYEPGLNEIVNKNYLSNRLKFTTNLSLAVKSSEIIFICVGTPTSKKNKSADLQYVFKVASEIGNYINKFKIIVTKSTVPVSTGDKIEKIILKKKQKKFFEVVSNPEFLREGEAIRDFRFPDRIVVGSNNKKIARKLESLYEPLIKNGQKMLFGCSFGNAQKMVSKLSKIVIPGQGGQEIPNKYSRNCATRKRFKITRGWNFQRGETVQENASKIRK